MFPTQVVPAVPPYIEEPVDGILEPGVPVDANGPVLTPVAVTKVAPTNPSFSGIAEGTVGRPIRWFGQEFYFRVWPIPRVVDVQNPLLNVDIPFQLWNAFLTPNEIDAIIATGADGLTLDIDDTATLDTLELRTVNVQITEDAPIQIGALFTFDMQYGQAAVSFIAVLADILPIQPQTAVVEKLEWKTNLIQHFDGSEVRIALRQRPRRYFQMALFLADDADRKLLYDKLYQVATRELIVPSVQYQSRLKRKTVIADNKLYCNPRRADLRVGEKVVIRASDGSFYLFEVEEVFSDHVTITTAFSQVIAKGSIVSNAFATRLPNKTSLSMQSISGGSQINVLVVNPRERVAFPDSGVAVPTFQGKPLLLRRPLAENAPEAFDVGLDVMDNEVGKPAYFTGFIQPFIDGVRKYLIQTLFDQDDLEHWREFLDAIRGQQKAFYTPTYREDMVYYEDGFFLSGSIDVVGTQYPSLYDGSPTYQQIEIESSAGTFQLKISTAENFGSFSTLRFATPISGVDLTDATVTRISFLVLVRLANDVVTLTHENTNTEVDLTLRTAVA